MPPNPSDTELVGSFLAARWRAEDGSAIIAAVRDQQGRQQTIKGPPDSGPTLTAGVTYRFHGTWKTHDKYGLQFEFAAFSAVEAHDRKGVIAYLQTVADNVGEKRAAKLWDAYGPFAVATLRQSPEKVAEAGIMSLEDAKEAAQTLHDASAFESVKVDLLALFSGRGFQANKLIKECLRLWRHRAAEMVRRNPYLLLLKKLPSCGWKRCDRLYIDLGHPPAKRKRQTLVAVAELRNERGGHTWVPVEQIGRAIQQAVKCGAEPVEAIDLGIRARLIARHRDRGGQLWLAEGGKARNEEAVAFHVRRLLGWTKSNRSKKPVRHPSEVETLTPGGELL